MSENHHFDEKVLIPESEPAQAPPASGSEPKKKRGRIENLTRGSRKGIPNKIPREVTLDVLKSFDKLGRHKYLMKIANGTASDRAAYIGLLGRVLPKETRGTIDHSVTVTLSWDMSGRSVARTIDGDSTSPSDIPKMLSNQDVTDAEIVESDGRTPMGHQNEPVTLVKDVDHDAQR